MLRLLRALLYTLILLTVALASFLTAMRFAIHGSETTVPQLTGLSMADAERAAQNNGLLLSGADRFYSSSVPAGYILSQMPTAGTTVRRGFRVQVAESLGAQTITIPNLVGQSERAAEMDARRRGLEPGSVSTMPTADTAAETVIAQFPASGAVGVATPRVSLLISAAAPTAVFVMPELVGMKLGAASDLVTAAGMKLAKVEMQPGSSSSAELVSAVVVEQSPTAGSRIAAGSTVTLKAYRPPPMTAP